MFPSEISLALPASAFVTSATMTPQPVAVAWCYFQQAAWRPELHQEWQLPLPSCLQNAVTKRKAEHLASRWLVQQTLAHFEVPDFILHNAPDRSPIWPDGIQASLSHSGDCVMLAVTHAPLCVGIDVEQIMAAETAQQTADMLMNTAERAYLSALPLPFAVSATLLFSLKESLYKALWPTLRQPMDFHQAELVALDLPHQCASLRLCQHFSVDFPRHTLLQARFWLQEKRVVTLLTHALPHSTTIPRRYRLNDVNIACEVGTTG